MTTIVLPAPVSPVSTVSPGPNSMSDSSMMPRSLILISWSTVGSARLGVGAVGATRGATPPVHGEVELLHEPVGEGEAAKRARRTGSLLRWTWIRAPGGRSTARRPSHHTTPEPCVPGTTSTASLALGSHDEGSGEECVGADGGEQECLDVGPDDRSTRGERVCRGPGRRGHDDPVAAPRRQWSPVDLDGEARSSARATPSRR